MGGLLGADSGYGRGSSGGISDGGADRVVLIDEGLGTYVDFFALGILFRVHGCDYSKDWDLGGIICRTCRSCICRLGQ